MPSVPARRAALTALVLLVAVLTGTSPSAAQEPSPAASPSPAPPADEELCAAASDESPVVVDVRTLAPRAPTSPDEPFQVTGRLVNCGEDRLRGVQVRLTVGSRVATRSELRLATTEPVIGDRRLRSQDAASPELAPGASTSFDVRVQVADLRLGSGNGVYPLAVQARARTVDGGTRGPVGLASTFVPWFPEGPVSPTRMAWVVPLVDAPHAGPGEVLRDDRLAQLLDSSGRLARVLDAGRTGARGSCGAQARLAEGAAAVDAEPCRGEPVPVTWAVDPDLLHTVELMTRPYRVLRDGERTSLPASAAAETWLTGLREAATAGSVLALPYGDPDVVALSRTDSTVKDDVGLLGRLGRSEARRLLEGAPIADVAWPPPGPVADVVDRLGAGTGTALLLDPSSVVTEPSQDRTPDARTTLPSTVEPVTALVTDDVLSRLAEAGPTSEGWQGARLAEQRWIAETAIIAAERPGQARTRVVAPSRRADLTPAVAAGAIGDTGRLPWLCGVPLADVAAGTERCAALPDPQGPSPVVEDTVLRASVPDRPALPASFVREIAEVRRSADQFTEQVLVDSDDAKKTSARLLRARGRAASTAWRTDPAGGRRMLALLQDDVAGLRGRIALIGGPTILTGRVGVVKLNVQNDLDQPVNVGVRLDPTSAARLTSEDTALQVVPGREVQQLSVRVEARTSGRFTARAGLVDASGRPFGDTVELEVRSTEYGRVALAVTGVAAAVLMVAAGARLTRRALGLGPARKDGDKDDDQDAHAQGSAAQDSRDRATDA